ncbi:MAG TPA: DUF177 domain-containing protein [Candidatus Manganitrophaceae bacterium]|nr:DUF177 domain-containing protein [Candidatus Manganitrophaceae bacterium]
MEIKVRDIPAEGLSLSYDEDPSEWDLEEKGLTVEGPIHVSLKVTKLNQNEVYIRGALSANLLSECSRCLKKFADPIQSDFHVDYVPESAISVQDEHELVPQDLDLHFYKEECIEVNDVIQGQLHLAAPMRPLCKPDCQGLCPHCGEDLNQKQCDCPKEPVDFRMTGLKDFFKKK